MKWTTELKLSNVWLLQDGFNYVPHLKIQQQYFQVKYKKLIGMNINKCIISLHMQYHVHKMYSQ